MKTFLFSQLEKFIKFIFLDLKFELELSKLYIPVSKFIF